MERSTVCLTVLLWSLIGRSGAISCTSQLQSLSCLPVFSHTPDNRPKCYCTSQCPDIQTLRETCFSGQLQTDTCGICLQCAPGFGEKCGGFGNAAGVCSGGLGCLVRYRPGQEQEHNKTGTCVTEQGKECSNPKSGVSCRPGQLGVPSDFVFCPEDCTEGSNRRKNPNAGFLFAEQSTRRNENTDVEVGFENGNIQVGMQSDQPGAIQTIGQGVRNVVGNVPDRVRDTVRDLLAGRK
eukprot:GFUD01026878.1.p1 GENE.GFUD01026878.1~~GFUD01026878.1.p1  ORF type:complete len:237 (-),score=58.60 GFUD01026878.1:157-867(-)